MAYNKDDSITDQAHFLNLNDGFGPPKKTKASLDPPVYKVISKFSNDEREIISNSLRNYMSRKWQKPRQSAVAAMAKVHLSEVNKFLNEDPAKRNKCSVPSIIKMINAIKLVIPNRPDLSCPLVHDNRKKAERDTAELKTKPDKLLISSRSGTRFTDEDRRLISNRLVKHLHSMFGFTPTSLAKKANIDIAHIDWLVTENANDKDRSICPDQDIVKIVNTAKLKIHGWEDLSYPLSEVDQKSEKVKEIFKEPEIKPEVIPVPGYEATKPVDSKSAKPEKSEEKKVIPVPATPSGIVEPNISDKKPGLSMRIQQIIDSLEEELFTTDEEMVAAACNFAETPTDDHRHEYFLKKEIARRIKQQIVLLNKVLE